MVQLRPLKNGKGCSECSSPDELVGRGRCCHILGGPKMEISKVDRGLYEVTMGEEKMKISAQQETIVNFFNSLPEIDDEKREKIINFLKEEN